MTILTVNRKELEKKIGKITIKIMKGGRFKYL